jgi:phosphatidylglycerol:prolipoprotein diacylglycerol transferase
MLPTVTWEINPTFITLPRQGVVLALGGFAAFSFLYGLLKKASDQLISGLFFAGLALIVGKFMPSDYGIRYYSLLFVVVFLGGHALLKWQITRAHGSAEDANDFIVYGVLGVLLGARLGHVLFYDLDKALEDPVWVLEIWTGGLASHGAVLGLITAMFLFCKKRGIPFLEGSDRFSFSAALGATLVRIGNLLNSEIVGKKTDGTWGFRFPLYSPDKPNPPLRHPSQIYEIVLGLSVLGMLYLLDKRLGKEKRPRGAMISAFFLMYFVGRFIVEFFKEYESNEAPFGLQIWTDTPLRMGQLLSIPGILLGAYGLYWSFKRRLPAEWPHAELPASIDDEDDEDDDDESEDDDDDESEDEREDEETDDDRKHADDDGAEDEDGEDSEPKKRAAATAKPATSGAAADKDDDVDSEFDAEGRLKKPARPEHD